MPVPVWLTKKKTRDGLGDCAGRRGIITAIAKRTHQGCTRETGGWKTENTGNRGTTGEYCNLEQQAELTEKRKDLWREDTKLDSLVSRAPDGREIASWDDGQGTSAHNHIEFILKFILGHRSTSEGCRQHRRTL